MCELLCYLIREPQATCGCSSYNELKSETQFLSRHSPRFKCGPATCGRWPPRRTLLAPGMLVVAERWLGRRWGSSPQEGMLSFGTRGKQSADNSGRFVVGVVVSEVAASCLQM